MEWTLAFVAAEQRCRAEAKCLAAATAREWTFEGARRAVFPEERFFLPKYGIVVGKSSSEANASSPVKDQRISCSI